MYTRRSSTMVEIKAQTFYLLCILTTNVAIFGGVNCMKDGRVVSMKELEWGESFNSHFSLPRTSRKTKSATMLELKHHISSSIPTLNLDSNFHLNLLHFDEARVSSIQAQVKSQATHIVLTSGVALQTLNYIINVKIGNLSSSVIVDTGSDLTWVQCQPCTYCYTQQNPIYDPSTSSTYHPIPCNSTSCTSILPSIETSGHCGLGRSNACNYALRYGDGSYTRGELALERVGLGDIYVEGFVFGCGRSNRGLFGAVSGLAGLGRTQLSLVSQTKAQFRGMFSYCLPSRVYNSSGNLVLGDDPSIYRNTTPITYTRLVQVPQQLPFYFLNLTGVSVGGVNLGLSKGVKIVFDSGTVITRLVPSMYNAIRDEFLKQFSEYPKAPGFLILDTCFDLSKYEEVRVPRVGLGFEGGAELNVDVTGILYIVKKDASQVCLAMTSLADDDGVGIIGNFQQKNQRVVYDNEGSRVGFGEESCSFS